MLETHICHVDKRRLRTHICQYVFSARCHKFRRGKARSSLQLPSPQYGKAEASEISNTFCWLNFSDFSSGATRYDWLNFSDFTFFETIHEPLSLEEGTLAVDYSLAEGRRFILQAPLKVTVFASCLVLWNFFQKSNFRPLLGKRRV